MSKKRVPSIAEQRRNELYTQAESAVVSVLQDHNVSADTAQLAASAVTDMLTQFWAGQAFSFPKDYAWRLTQRDIAVYNKFTGQNHLELAREYGVRVNAIYKLIRRIKKIAHELEGQEDMFK